MQNANETPTGSDDLVTIKRSLYDRLRKSEQFLMALEAAGVDNWDGYSIAYRKVHGDEDDE